MGSISYMAVGGSFCITAILCYRIIDVAVGCLVVNVVLAIRFLYKYKFVGFASMGSMRQVLLRLLDKSGRRV